MCDSDLVTNRSEKMKNLGIFLFLFRTLLVVIEVTFKNHIKIDRKRFLSSKQTHKINFCNIPIFWRKHKTKRKVIKDSLILFLITNVY